MEKTNLERAPSGSEDSNMLTRNRSFKSKQLVRSQAIRETHSPPRTSSPAFIDKNVDNCVNDKRDEEPIDAALCGDKNYIEAADRTLDGDNSSQAELRDGACVMSDSDKKHTVEIQITPGAPGCWDLESQMDQRMRTKRWLFQKNNSDTSRDLLSNNPRVYCVCGYCAACSHCRGRKRRKPCPVKQDSGIACSDDCPDCLDNEQSALYDALEKSGSLDAEDLAYYCRCPERKEKPKSVPLIRSDSDDKPEPTGPELVGFLKETLNKNPRDRMTLLKIEKELTNLVIDNGRRCIVRFPVMTSYGRMLVHRCASLFQLSHHLDTCNKNCVLVSKSGTSGGCLPCTSFRQWCSVTFPPSPQRQPPDVTNAKSILKREAASLEECGAGAGGGARSKSLEQRERDYERVRRRIFSTDNCTQGEPQWPWSSGPVKLLTPETGRNKLLKVQSLESSAPAPASWRSRGPVSKSHSFSGSAPDHQPRLLSRQGDLASSSWRLSPSSSGYKTLSLRSTDSVTPSPTGGASPEPAVVGPGVPGGATGAGSAPGAGAEGAGVAGAGAGGAATLEGVVWAVTDMSAVPPGAIVIHPQTGRPLTNSDGSIYHFDPANPPLLYDPAIYKEEPKMDNSDKKRGRLEKQHSFMDNECECQPAEDCHSTCCSECRRQDGYQQKTTSDKETNTKPLTPTKPRYEAVQNHREESIEHKLQYEEVANQDRPEEHLQYEPANQQPTYDALTNHNVGARRSFETLKEPPGIQRPNHDVNNRQFKLTNQESPEMPVYAQQYQSYAGEEVSSPQQNPYLQQDLSNMPGVMAQAKVAPMHVPDPNMRPMSLTNMVYPTQIPPGFPYVGHRMDTPIQQAMYHQAMQQEEHKQLAASPHANESTFRIDPSYPYAAVDYAAAYGSCVDTNALQQHRSYSVPYNQVEVQQAVLPPTYPVGNVLLPQPHLQPYTYQEPVQWAGVSGVGGVGGVGGATPKLVVPDLYPVLQYPPPFQYNFMYPQVVPQPYQICPPMYPTMEKPEQGRRNSLTRKQNSIPTSSRATPQHTPQHTPPDDRKVPYDRRDEISTKIQQIKEQMAQLNTKDRDKDRKRDDWKRKNNGNGILGSYPSNNYGGRVMGRPTNDETQLSNEARVIVNSIRNMQAKNTYQGDMRREYRRARPERPPRAHPPHHPHAPHHAHHAPLIRAPCPNILRQMSPGTWCRRSPGPVHPVLNNPRRPHPDARNGARR